MAFFDFDEFEEEMRKMRERMDRLFAELRKPMSEFEVRRPIAEIQETPDKIVLTMELPGVEKQDINLEVTENRIRVKAIKKKAEEIKKKGYYSAMREAGAFYHEETLPSAVVPEKAEATYKNGILKVVLPKKEKSKVMVKKVKVK